MDYINSQLQKLAPGFSVVGSKDCTLIELYYKKIAEEHFENTHYFLTARKYGYPYYMNLKLDMNNNIVELYPTVIRNRVSSAIPSCKDKVPPFKYRLKPDTAPYCAYSVAEKRLTHWYCVPKYINIWAQNDEIEGIKMIYRENLPISGYKRIYFQISYDKNAMRFYHCHGNYYNVDPDYFIVYFNEMKDEGTGHYNHILEEVDGVILGYNPFNENYEKVLVNLNL